MWNFGEPKIMFKRTWTVYECKNGKMFERAVCDSMYEAVMTSREYLPKGFDETKVSTGARIVNKEAASTLMYDGELVALIIFRQTSKIEGA